MSPSMSKYINEMFIRSDEIGSRVIRSNSSCNWYYYYDRKSKKHLQEAFHFSQVSNSFSYCKL